jgi:GT2 family glycosyltransferase
MSRRRTECDTQVELPEQFSPGKIGVVTVTFGSQEVLPDFFASLDKQTYRNFVLFAVDNHSSDNSVEQLNAYHGCERVVIENEANLGVAAGNNQGILAAIDAGCEYVLLLNNDVVFGPDLFRQLIDGMRQHRCDMTTPLIYYYDRPNVIWCAGGEFQRWAGMRVRHRGADAIDDGQFHATTAVNYAPTCCILFRREVFGVVGLMDEAYFVYVDDLDFLFRAWKRGLRMYYLPTAKLWHKVSSLTGAESPFSVRYNTRNRAYFSAKHLRGIAYVLTSFSFLGWYYIQRVRGKYDAGMFKRKLEHRKEGIALAKSKSGGRVPDAPASR